MAVATRMECIGSCSRHRPARCNGMTLRDQPEGRPSWCEVTVPAASTSTIEQQEYANGLVLLAETMPGVQSAAFTLLLPAGAAYEGALGFQGGGCRHDGGGMDHARRRSARQPGAADGAR